MKTRSLNMTTNQLMFLKKFNKISPTCSTVFPSRDSIRIVSRITSKIFSHVSEPIEKKDFDKIQTEKAKIISVLAQHLYITCTLSKDQIKNITTFWKSIIGFIAPEHRQIVKKSGCVIPVA